MLLYDNKSKILTIEKYRKIISTIIIAGFIVAICFVICFKLNVAGIYAAYLQSNWASDGGILRNARFSLDIDGFQRMLSNPLDDYVEQGYEHSHSLMLEYGRAFGFSVYLMLSVFRLLTLKDALVFAQNVKDNAIKYLVVPGILSLNIYYSLEPNGYEHRHIWMLGLFISGMIRGKLDLIKQDKTERFIGRIEVL